MLWAAALNFFSQEGAFGTFGGLKMVMVSYQKREVFANEMLIFQQQQKYESSAGGCSGGERGTCLLQRLLRCSRAIIQTARPEEIFLEEGQASPHSRRRQAGAYMYIAHLMATFPFNFRLNMRK